MPQSGVRILGEFLGEANFGVAVALSGDAKLEVDSTSDEVSVSSMDELAEQALNVTMIAIKIAQVAQLNPLLIRQLPYGHYLDGSEGVNEYRIFVVAPPDSWCSRHHQYGIACRA